MKRIQTFFVLAILALPFPEAAVGQDAADGEFRGQFQAVVDGLNRDSFKPFHAAINKAAMLDRIYGARLIDPAVKSSFSGDFQSAIEASFMSGFPKARNAAQQGAEIIGTIIDFRASGDRGRAVVRYAAKGYRYSYHAYDLARDEKGRLVIVDWLDYYLGGWFSDYMGDALVRTMPGKPAIRNLLGMQDASERQLFQVGELLKAARDSNGQRFWQIYDDLEGELRAEREIVVLNLQVARALNHRGRLAQAIDELRRKFPDERIFSLLMAEHFIVVGAYAGAIEQFEYFQSLLGLRDGVTESFKASAATAMSDHEAAVEFALGATRAEPGLALSWWSLLRARTGAGDYAGATEALTRLEDDFGESLTPEKLGRDRFLKVLAGQQEYLDWRASRSQ